MKKKNNNKDLGFNIPQGYFESNVDRLFDKATNSNEVVDAPFTVPQDYFSSLEDRIVQAVNKEKDNHRDHGFTVPTQYFEQLESRVCQSVDSSSKFLNKTTGAGYDVPPAYFDSLEQRVIENTVEAGGRVVSLDSKMPAWVMPMLAVAAAIVAIIAIDGFWNDNSLSLQDLNDDELELYIVESNFTVDQDAMDILFSNSNAFEDRSFETIPVDNDALLDYLADEVEMNQIIKE